MAASRDASIRPNLPTATESANAIRIESPMQLMKASRNDGSLPDKMPPADDVATTANIAQKKNSYCMRSDISETSTCYIG